MRHITPALYGKIASSILFQLCWFALVLSAGTPLSGLTSLLSVSVSLLLVLRVAARPLAGVVFVLVATLGGSVLDSGLIALEILDPARVWLPHPLAPLWLVALWTSFATFLFIVLDYLHARPLIQWNIGFFGGPLAYWSGARLGAIQFQGSLLLSLLALAVGWGCTMLLLCALSSRLQRPTGRHP